MKPVVGAIHELPLPQVLAIKKNSHHTCIQQRHFSLRMRLIKRYVTKYYGTKLEVNVGISESRTARKEGNLWQRRFWEHLIRDEKDFTNHCEYIHYNPVRHGLCDRPQDWTFSSIHRFVKAGICSSNWGEDNVGVDDGALRCGSRSSGFPTV